MPKELNGRREDLSEIHAWKMVPLAVINDTKCSDMALWLFIWLFTRPEGWDYSVSGVASARKLSRNTIQKYLAELSEAGYLTIRKDEKSSKFAYVWSFNPHPNGVTISTDTQILGSGKLSTSDAIDNDGDGDGKNGALLAAENLSTNIEETSYITKLPKNNPLEPPQSQLHRRKSATTIPDDWEPDAIHAHRAEEFGLNLRLEAEKFTNYFVASGKKKRDWPRTFHNWLIRAYEFQNPFPSRNNTVNRGGGGNSAYRTFTHND